MQKVWETEKYYSEAAQASLDLDHPAIKRLSEILLNKKKVLDVGCGEGTRLRLLLPKGAHGYGVDISKLAISKAVKHKFKNIKFVNGSAESLPYNANFFDLTYSVSVLEHLSNPDLVIEEMIRVTKKGGYIFLFSPNYGSPNRSSPPYIGSRVKKLLVGYLLDLVSLFYARQPLGWEEVKPIATTRRYVSDWDTTVEPYVGSLISFLKIKKIDIIERSTCWNEELPNPKPIQVCFKILSKMGVYPFTNWGPHFYIVGKKGNG